ncbi:MAG: hypothetical protein QMD86_00310 [Patescibacteria group bacterium]|nr:hypothetical protein [Patescibacteria group bacterium]
MKVKALVLNLNDILDIKESVLIQKLREKSLGRKVLKIIFFIFEIAGIIIPSRMKIREDFQKLLIEQEKCLSDFDFILISEKSLFGLRNIRNFPYNRFKHILIRKSFLSRFVSLRRDLDGKLIEHSEVIPHISIVNALLKLKKAHPYLRIILLDRSQNMRNIVEAMNEKKFFARLPKEVIPRIIEYCENS